MSDPVAPAKIKTSEADALEKLRNAAAALPTGEQLAKAGDEIRSRAEQMLSTARIARA